ncbi:MAG: hypothetical protein M3P18_24070 [Actinomycetota bacterium]|nr:hypothetical protein [Actinomycetota bacterium]
MADADHVLMRDEYLSRGFRVRVPHLSRAAGVTLTATLLMISSWIVLHLWVFGRGQIIDTPVYWHYGEAMLNGRVPYRDFQLEYPPGALPAFVLPALRSETLLDYRYWFDALMLVCAICMSGFVAMTLTSLGASLRRTYASVAFVALAFLALGSVVYSRFDVWPALLVSAGIASLVAGPAVVGFAALGLAVAAKLYALVLLPPALTFIARRVGKREALKGLSVFSLVIAAAFGPFIALAPAGLWESLHRQGSRPLHIESLGSAVLLTAHQLGAYTPSVAKTFGSDNLVGALPRGFALVAVLLQALAIIAVWLLFRRGEASPDRFIVASTAAVTALVAFGKVLSPQFLVWLIPLVALLSGGLGKRSAALLGTALVLTQLWFPHHYWALRDLGAIAWVVLVRDLVLVGLFAVLANSLRVREETPAPPL